jgi:hypothetical protein
MNVRNIAGAAVAFALLAGSAHAQWFGTNSVGMPAITNFAERRQLKQIFELRDQNVATYTYLVGLDGKVGQLLCNSVGFGIPYATQYTSPQRLATTSVGATTLPQADPNTLFSPASAEGTWVLCVNPETNKPTPLYVEPKIIVSPFKLVKE